MEEMEALRRQYEAILKRVENIDEIGCLELTEITKDLNSLKSRAGISANSFTHDTDNDITEVREVLNVWDELDNNIIDLTMKVDLKHQSRWELAQTKFTEYRRFKEYRRENQKRINEYKFELDKHRALLNHVSDPFAKENMEDTIKDDERHIQRAEELNSKYDKELADYARDIMILLEGGAIRDLDKIDEEEMRDEIKRDNFKPVEEDKTKKEDKPKPKKEDEPLPKPKKPAVKREEEKEEEEDEKSIVLPMPPTPEEDETTKKRKFKDAEDDDKKKTGAAVVGGVPPRFRDLPEPEEDDDDLDLPPAPENDEEQTDLPGEIDDEFEQEPEEPLEPTDATVKEPKEKLWKKVANVIKKAIIFLGSISAIGALGVGIHNHSHLKDLTKEATIENTENEEEQEQEQTPQENTEDDNKTEEGDKANIPSDNKDESPSVAPNNTDNKSAENKDTDKKDESSDKKEETDSETLDITLNPGETVFNTKTNVEVGYNGNAAHQNSDGNVVDEKDRDLEQKGNQSIVTPSDLERQEEASTNFPLAGTTERTGQETSEEEAKANMTDEEKSVAESQEQAWFDFLEESGLLKR